jgi:L-2-hydroxyglutarate oxidase LhgO
MQPPTHVMTVELPHINEQSRYEVDICVIGAGVIGLALARQLSASFPSCEIVVLEQQAGIGQETSSRNSEVIHAGLYYPPGSNKARLCVRGQALLYDYCMQHNIPCRRIGKLIVAQRGEEHQLQQIAERALACGVNNLRLMSAHQIKRLEPAVQAECALWSPGTGIIDSHSFMVSLRQYIESTGNVVATRSRFLRAQPCDNLTPGFDVDVETEGDSELVRLHCRVLINSAGLSALIKGNYFSLSGRSPFAHLIYPVPDSAHRGLGVHATLDLAGQCRFGPDIEPVGVIDYRVDEARKPLFVEAIRRYYPALDESRLHPDYSGIRTRLMINDGEAADFMIQGHTDHGCPGLIQLFGIESPGLTASLAIAEEVSEQLKIQGLL